MKNSSFNLAVIGCGKWGLNHIRTAIKLFGKNVKYVVDIDEEKFARVHDLAEVKEFRKHFKCTDDLESVLRDKAINSVIVATPAETHYSLTRMCLQAGKNVLVEKPVSLFSNQARELDALAEKKKLILMVGHLLLFHPAIVKIKQMIDDGTLGKLQYIYSNRLNLGTIRKEENILWSFAPHDISVLQYLIGKDPIKLDAVGGTFLQPGIHDVTLTTMEYPDNIHAHIHVSWLHPFKEHRLVVIGDKSMVVFEDSRKENKLILYPKGIDWIQGEPVKRDEDFQVIDYGNDQPLALEQQHFKECVLSGKTALTDGKNGVKVLEILEQAQERLEGQRIYEKEMKSVLTNEKEKKYFVHESSFVDDGCDIGEGTKIWHFSHVQSGSVIGKKCSLGQNVNVANKVKIGNQVKIQNNVSIYEGVELEDYVFCGPSMVFTNILEPRSEFPQRGSEFYLKTLVKYGSSIGANATIVCGITIGRYAFIGAGAVVTKDVPDYALMAGVPARRIGWMSRHGARLLNPDKNGIMVCPKSGWRFREEKPGILKCLDTEQDKPVNK
jgi:UDP-2-acetamido-3-amino-2,3-dideoxy-glucuronate N-acetyltransferase